MALNKFPSDAYEIILAKFGLFSIFFIFIKYSISDSINQIKNKTVDGVHGIQTRDCRMKGTDEDGRCR